MNLLLCGATWHIVFFVFSKLTTRLRHFQTLMSKSHVRMLLATFKCFSRQSDFQKLIVGSATSKVRARCWTSCRTLRYGDFALNSSLGGAVLVGWSFHWFVQKILFCRWCPCTWTWRSAMGRSRRYWFAKMMLAAKNFQYWAATDYEDRNLAQVRTTLSASRWFWKGCKVSTYFPVSRPHGNRIICSIARLADTVPSLRWTRFAEFWRRCHIVGSTQIK